jgi:hypothetical protein
MASEVLRSIVSLWERQIDLAKKSKKRQFDDTAQRAWDFMGKSYRQLYLEREVGDENEKFPTPYYKMRRNLAAEYVAVMLPFIHAKVPTRLCEPRRPLPPPELVELIGATVPQDIIIQEQILSWLMSWYLNWIPKEYDLSREERTALPEALVKGRCLVWHHMEASPFGMMPVSNYDTVDGLLIDPDCEQMRDAAYIIRIRNRSAWKLAREFNIPVSQIRGLRKSNHSQALESSYEITDVPTEERSKLDVVEYYEVYSRMGIGVRLRDTEDVLKEHTDALESLGPYIRLVIIPGLDHPANLPPDILSDPTAASELKARLEWPIPFHQGIDPWPYTTLDFLPNARNPWAQSPLEGCLPLLVFVDHLYSFLMSRIRTTCRDIYVTSTQVQEALQNALQSGYDHEIVPWDGEPGRELAGLIQVIKGQELNPDMWRIVPMIENAFERSSGMTPLLYGSDAGRQMRSAKEADIREGHATSRPNDFADMVEDWNSRIAAKEAIATRLFVPPPSNLFGETPQDEFYSGAPLSQAWAQLVSVNGDPVQAAAQLRYTVEAGSGRRKNKQARVSDAMQITQSMLQPLLQIAMTPGGNPDPYNALVDMLAEMYEMPMSRLHLSPMALPQPPVGPEQEEPVQ